MMFPLFRPGTPDVKPLDLKKSPSSIGSIAKIALDQLSLFRETICSALEFWVDGGVNFIIDLGRAADFTSDLKKESALQIFDGTKYKDLPFNEALLSYRKDVGSKGSISEENKKIARKIMMQSTLPKAYKVLSRCLPKAHKSIPLSVQFELDRKSIKTNAYKAGQGVLHRESSKFCGEFGVFFDPHMNGNLPFLLGTRKVNGSKVNVLRHPVPTVEMGSTKISEEYRAFLESCKSKKEKVLYSCLLNSKTMREIRLVRTLHKLGSEYKDVFHFIRMPLDGPLTRVDSDESLEGYRQRIERDIYNEIKHPAEFSNEFIFGSKEIAEVVDKKYRAISSFVYDQISSVYKEKESKASRAELKILLKEKKQAFMMLFCSVLRTVLIKELKIHHYTNTCKDGIDRGAAHLMSDLLWDGFLTDDLQNNHLKMRMNAAWPAFMAKTQPIIKSRAEWMISLSKWVEGATELNLRDKIVKEYFQKLHLRADSKMLFND